MDKVALARELVALAKSLQSAEKLSVLNVEQNFPLLLRKFL